jgi:hypothetical protein
MSIITAVSAAGLAAGLALTGASAVNAAPADLTLPSGGILEQRVTKFCGQVPDLLSKVDKAQTRINGDADTKGSLAWLKAKQDQAAANHHPRVADRLGLRLKWRTERLARLPKVKSNLTKAKSECATLGLPADSNS